MSRFRCGLHVGSVLLLLLGGNPSRTTTAVIAFHQLVRISSSKTPRTSALYHASSAIVLKGPVIHCGIGPTCISSSPTSRCGGGRHFSLSLRMSSSTSSSSSPNGQQLQKKKINGRKNRVVVGYRLAMIIYSMITIAMLLGPTFKHGLSMLPMAGNYAAGPLMAASFCYILQHAAQANRLSSETYKRANLYLSQYGAVYLAAAILVKCSGGPLTGGTKKLLSPVLLLASLVSFVNGIKGWSYGAKGGWDNKQQQSNNKSVLVKDFVDVFFTSWIRILSVVPKSLASLGFLAATIFAACLKIVTVIEIFRILIPEILATLATTSGTTTTLMSVKSASLMASKMIQFTRLSLLSSICLTLKDAADRNRLSSTTFIQYAGLTTFTFAFMAANSHFAIIKDGQLLTTTVVAAASALFSIFSVVIGLVSIRIKNKESNKV